MTGLADPPQEWNAETATAAVLETLRPAGYPAGGWLVKAGASRLGNLISSKDCLFAPKFQALHDRSDVNFWAMPAARTRSPRESGMDAKTFANEAADYLADRARDKFRTDYEACSALCESEIERIFLAALIAAMQPIGGLDLWFRAEPVLPVELMDAVIEYPRLSVAAVIPQANIGTYRVDFLIAMRTTRNIRRGVVVECDGHDYHERTKQQAKRDRKRDRDLQAIGLHALRFTGSEICSNPFSCANEVVSYWRRLEDAEATYWAKLGEIAAANGGEL